MAVVSLALGVLGCAYCLPGLLAIVLGVLARRRIRDSNGMLTGERLALWGIILGSFWPLIYLLAVWLSFAAS